MATRFVGIDRDTALLLPPDMREWVPADHLVLFIRDAVEAIDVSQVQVNTRLCPRWRPSRPRLAR